MAQYKVQMRDVLTLPNVIFLDDDAACSCILVGIAHASAASAVQNFAASKGVPATTVKTVQSPRYVNRPSLRDNIRPIKGGSQITSRSNAICTVTATVFHHARAKKGLITASHCTAAQTGVDSMDFFQPGGALFSGDFVGTEVIDPALTNSIAGCPTGRLCRRSDAAFIEFHNTLGAVGQLALPAHMCNTTPCDETMTSTTDVLTIVGTGGAALVGQHRDKIGRTTGWTRALVTNDCIDINVSKHDGSDSGVTMVCQNIVAAGSGPGDSGAPVFELLQNNRVVLAGVMWGGADDGSNFVFSTLPDVEAELGTMDFF